MKDNSRQNENKLWTRDFTIITVGSIISMFGNSMSGFAVSLMVLDFTKSTLLYAIYLTTFTVPQLIMPIFSGAILDRFSRRKTIYTLDFISAGLYGIAAFILHTGYFNFPVFAIYCFILGSIQSIYMVAYESYYPLLISEGNYSKAYSIASTLETLTVVMIPISTWLYNKIGITPLLVVDAFSFLLAAIMETRLRGEERYIEVQKQASMGDEMSHGKRMLADVADGFRYMMSENGLLRIAVYFTFSAFGWGVSEVICLPYFKENFPNSEYDYIMVFGMAFVGRTLGGLWHYRHKLPVKHKYKIALAVYIIISLIDGFYLYLPAIWMMQALNFIAGVGGVTSYTIRISSTQSYVPDERKGRFNGAFHMLNTVGMLVGQMFAGVFATLLPQRAVLASAMTITIIAAVIFIGGGRKEVSAIYNMEK